MFAGNRAKSGKEYFELVRLWELRLKEAALCGLWTRCLRRKRYAKNGGWRRMCLQVQVEELEQEVAVLRSDGRPYVPFVSRGLLKLQNQYSWVQIPFGAPII